jgi:hypothetical protein
MRGGHFLAASYSRARWDSGKSGHEDEGAALEPEQPIEYERDNLAEDIEYLATFPQAATARDLGLTERGWRKVAKRQVTPRSITVVRIKALADRTRADEKPLAPNGQLQMAFKSSKQKGKCQNLPEALHRPTWIPAPPSTSRQSICFGICTTPQRSERTHLFDASLRKAMRRT